MWSFTHPLLKDLIGLQYLPRFITPSVTQIISTIHAGCMCKRLTANTFIDATGRDCFTDTPAIACVCLCSFLVGRGVIDAVSADQTQLRNTTVVPFRFVTSARLYAVFTHPFVPGSCCGYICCSTAAFAWLHLE